MLWEKSMLASLSRMENAVASSHSMMSTFKEVPLTRSSLLSCEPEWPANW